MTLDIYGHLLSGGGDRAELAAASRALLTPLPTENVVPLTRRCGADSVVSSAAVHARYDGSGSP
jgi:hypothetical protein